MPRKPHVLITDFIETPDVEQRLLGGEFTIEAADASSGNELIDRLPNADFVMMYHLVSVPSESIKLLEKCRLIVRCGVGFDNVGLALLILAWISTLMAQSIPVLAASSISCRWITA